MSRIAIVDLLFHWPPRGGSFVDVAGVAEGLQRSGHEVRLFVPGLDDTQPRGTIVGEPPFPIEVLPFTPWNFQGPAVAAAVRKAVAAFRPDRVLVTDGYFLKIPVIRALLDFPVILRLYAYEMFCLNNKRRILGRNCHHTFIGAPMKCLLCLASSIIRPPIKWALGLKTGNVDREVFAARAWRPSFRRMFHDTMRRVAGFIVYNRIAADLVQPYGRPVWTIPTGVDVARFKPRPRTGAGPQVILMSGRIDEPDKGFPFLLEACRQLRRTRTDFELRLTSQKGCRPDDPFVKDVGWLPPAELPRLYADCDIAVVPSLWEEPFGIVAIEAMAGGRPVIATRVGGLQTIVLDGETGFLVEPGNVAGLARALGRLLDDTGLQRTMGEAGRKRVEQVYDWPVLMNGVYREVFP